MLVCGVGRGATARYCTPQGCRVGDRERRECASVTRRRDLNETRHYYKLSCYTTHDCDFHDIKCMNKKITEAEATAESPETARRPLAGRLRWAAGSRPKSAGGERWGLRKQDNLKYKQIKLKNK
jgi:hypothetical protein